MSCGVTSRLANLWEDTAVPSPPTPPLQESATADVAVIGAGYLGLAAALHLADAGAKVLVLEAEAPGWGASGRNGGQIIPGLKYDPDEIEAMFGRENGERLWRFAGATADVVFGLIERHKLNAEARRTAWIQAIHSPKSALRARRRAEQWQRRGARVDYLDEAATAAITGTNRYIGAFVDRRAGALHPLSYARELARAAQARGARVHGRSAVARLARKGAKWAVSVANGAVVNADAVLICTNAYSGSLIPGLDRTIVAANSLQIATTPLPDSLRRSILPGGEVLSDTRKIIRYYRLDSGGRLIMGGRGPYRDPGPEHDWDHLKRDVHSLFPALREVTFSHRWGGRVAIHTDYIPHLHEPQPSLLVAIGCQGRGVGWQTSIGIELAKRALNPAHEFPLPLTPVRAMPLHPFKAVGASAMIAIYRVLDRLGFS